MMKKTLLAVLFLLLGTSTSLFAQIKNVDDLCSQLFVHKITKGDMVQTKKMVTTKKTREMTSSGKFILASEGIALIIEKPFASTTVVTEFSLVKITGDGTKTVTRTKDNLVYSNISSCVKALFTNNSAELEKNFTCEVTADGNSWELVLTPKDATIASSLESIKLAGTSDGNAAELNSLTMVNAKGNSTTCVFSNQIYPEKLDDADLKLLHEK